MTRRKLLRRRAAIAAAPEVEALAAILVLALGTASASAALMRRSRVTGSWSPKRSWRAIPHLHCPEPMCGGDS